MKYVFENHWPYTMKEVLEEWFEGIEGATVMQGEGDSDSALFTVAFPSEQGDGLAVHFVRVFTVGDEYVLSVEKEELVEQP